jgi:AraC-like DNA-binding protein
MMAAPAQLVGEVLIERYRYGPGPASAGELHVHEHWQWCLYVGGPGSYVTRAGRTVFPSGTLTVIAPGESHAPHDPDDRHAPSACLVAYLPEDQVPVHAGVVIDCAATRRAFAGLWSAHDRLHADVALTAFLATTQRPGARPTPAGAPGSAVSAAREYLHEHATEPVTLAELAAVARLSPTHLVRAFGHAYGLPPHRYQTALRIDRAKRLLAARRLTIGEIAHAAGFADHAHFTRTFRRRVGLVPSVYAKNVQDTEPPVRLDHGL